jgi:hypothetical protein
MRIDGRARVLKRASDRVLCRKHDHKGIFGRE